MIAQKEARISLPQRLDQAFAASQVADEEATAGGFQGPNVRLGTLLEGSLSFDIARGAMTAAERDTVIQAARIVLLVLH